MKAIHREFLPSNTASVHASTIEMWNGHPVFAWFGGSREGAQDISIYLYNLNDEEDVIVLGNKDFIPRWNPILFVYEGSIYLFEKAGIFCDRWQTFLHNISKWDKDITNREIVHNRKVIPAGLNGPVKTRPLVQKKDLDSNILIDKIYCGSSVETLYDWTSYIEEYEMNDGDINFLHRSVPLIEPVKRTYQNPYSGKTERSLGLIQPTIWEEVGDDGSKEINVFYRSSRGLGVIYHSYLISSQQPSKWSQPKPTNLPNPNSGIDVAVCNGKIYMAWNPSDKSRAELVVSEIRHDKNSNLFEIGETIPISVEIDEYNFREKGCNSPEMSYPYMIAYNGELHLTYTYGRSKIEYCIISVEEEDNGTQVSSNSTAD